MIKHVELSKLTDAVRHTIDLDQSSHKFENISIEDANLPGDDNFLRVLLFIKKSESVDDSDVDRIQSAVEKPIAAIDDRFPSLRFVEN